MTFRKLPWGLVSIITVVGGLNLVFVGCGSDETDAINDTDAGDGTASSSGSTSSGSTTSSGGSSGTTSSGGDAAFEASILQDGQACLLVGQNCLGGGDCCSKICGTNKTCEPPGDGGQGICSVTGTPCLKGTECCSLVCTGNQCSGTACKTDNPPQACPGGNADCCSGNCVSGMCAAVPTTGGTSGACRTEGNTCTASADCCSKQCIGGKCGDVSFCQQTNDVCASDFECCTGICAIANGALYGRCAPYPVTNCNPAGTVCTGLGCDNKCCSLSCGPVGTTGVNICQPPSGCRPSDEVCAKDTDCCGGPGLLTGQKPNGQSQDNTSCDIPNGATYGTCTGEICEVPGDTCKAKTGACGGAANNCCESLLPDGGQTPPSYCNAHPDECCSRDALGIPRCRGVNFLCTDAGVAAGSTCVTSADCCGAPCILGKCNGATSCQKSGETCTISADCCAPLPCVVPTGSTKGICGGTIGSDGGVQPPPPDAGTSDSSTPPPDSGTCSLYGQGCNMNSDCCSGVPCNGGRCVFQ